MPADIEAGGPLIQLAQHALGQVHVDATDWPDQGELVGEAGGNILSARCPLGDLIGGHPRPKPTFQFWCLCAASGLRQEGHSLGGGCLSKIDVERSKRQAFPLSQFQVGGVVYGQPVSPGESQNRVLIREACYL